MPESKASSALFERIAQLARSQFGEGHLLATADTGSRLLEEHLDFLKGFEPERLADVEEVRTLLEISKLVDCIQDGTSRFSGPERTRGFLSDRYLTLVANLDFASAPVDPELRKRYEEAERILYVDPPFRRTEEYEEFCLLRRDIEQKELSLLEKKRLLGTSPEASERERLAVEISEYESLIKEQRDVLDALDRARSFTLAEKTKDAVELEASGLPRSVRDALEAFDLFKITDAISNDTHVMCAFFPSHLSDDNWASIKLSGQEIQTATGESRYVEPSPESAELAFPEDADIESVEVEVQILSVQRPWFWNGLFENHLWRWKSPSEPVSEGVENDRGLIPAYVAGLVVARNLIVRGRSPESPPAAGTHRLGNLAQILSSRRLVTVRPGPASSHLMIGRRLTPAPPALRVDRIKPDTRDTRPLSKVLRFENRFRVRMPLSRFLTFRGGVKDEKGIPVLGATVQLQKSPSGAVQRKLTVAEGRFGFELVTKGTYILTVTKPGFITHRQSVQIEQEATFDIVLKAEVKSAPLMTVQLVEAGSGGADRPFQGSAEILVKGVENTVQRTERVEGVSEAKIRLEPGRYEIRVLAREARSVTPPQFVVNLSRDAVIAFRIDTGVILRNPQTFLVGFVCRRVPKSPDPDPTLNW